MALIDREFLWGFYAFRPKTPDKPMFYAQIGNDRGRDAKGVAGPCAKPYEYPGEDANTASEAVDDATV